VFGVGTVVLGITRNYLLATSVVKNGESAKSKGKGQSKTGDRTVATGSGNVNRDENIPHEVSRKKCESEKAAELNPPIVQHQRQTQ
jgi:hypothetical protein